MTHDVRTMCSRCGGWYWAGDAHTCPTRCHLAPAPVTPTDVHPVSDRPGTTWRFHVVDHTTLILRARLEHDAAPASIGASL